nr:dephospho-CoA kinase [Prochlorococcus marinus]
MTGGIASGKSTVAKFLVNSKNIPILDADLYSKELLGSGSYPTQKVINRYGNLVIQKENGLQVINRLELGKIIFSNKKERIWLENLLHPLVEEKIKKELTKHKSYQTIALIIPLLFEANLTYLCSEIWVVYCTLQEQYTRLIKRNNLTYNQAKERIESQFSLDYKKNLADKIINNHGTMDSLYKKTEELL